MFNPGFGGSSSSGPETLRDLLRKQRDATKEAERRLGRIIPWVFHRDGERIRDCYHAWRAACHRAGVLGTDGQPKRPHDFRRTAVRNLERAGVPRSVAMQLIGHKTESIYRRYAITKERDLREGVKKLAALDLAVGASRTVLPMRKGTIGAQSAVGG